MTVIHNSRHIVIPPLLGVRTFAPRSAAASWWVVAGKTCVAAYQPKGAADIAASYVNLANPGTYDAAPGVEPTFDTATGWTFDGVNDVLKTGITPANNQTWSVLVRFSNVAATGYQYVAGIHINDTTCFGIQWRNLNTSYTYRNGGTSATVASGPTAGVVAVVGANGYLDGVDVADIDPGGGASFAFATIGLGAAYANVSLAVRFLPCKIQAAVIYSDTLSAAQVATVSAAMAAL